LAGLCLLLASPAPALAQRGTGLYEPFPGERAGEYSLDFVRGLRGNRERLLALTGNDLDRGVTLAPSGGAPDTGAASDRGEPAVSFAPSMGWAPAVALVLLAVAMTGAGVSLARRS
jgi:hypothetical protein